MSWYYVVNGKREGPIGTEELLAKLGAVEIAPADLVWKDGMADWRPAGEIPELVPTASASEGEAPGLGPEAAPASPSPANPPGSPGSGTQPDSPAAPAPAAVPLAAPGTGAAASNQMPAQPPPGAPVLVTPPPTSGLAIASMVCGIVSLVLCYVWALAGIPAVVCGHLALKSMRTAAHPIEGRGMAIAGLVTGYLSIVVQIIFIVVVVVALVAAANAS